MKRRRSCPPIQTGSASFAGFRYPAEVILLAVRWYLRFGLSYRDLEGRCCICGSWGALVDAGSYLLSQIALASSSKAAATVSPSRAWTPSS